MFVWAAVVSDGNSAALFKRNRELMETLKYKKLLLQTLKIAFGSSLSIFIADALNFQFAASAGMEVNDIGKCGNRNASSDGEGFWYRGDRK